MEKPPNGATPGHDLENLSADTPQQSEAVELEPTALQKLHVSWQRLVAVNCTVLIAGMNDAATGALLPYIKSSYDIGLLFVAIVYLANFCGWVLAAFTNVHVTARFGRGGALMFGASTQILSYALNFWKPPFALFVVSFFLTGLGVAYLDAQGNVIVANTENSHRWLGLFHAAYGLGALITPLIATALASHTPKWHYFYLLLLGCCCLNVISLFLAFRADISSHAGDASALEANRQLKGALSRKAVWIMCVFFFLYVGAEVTAGGWIVEFLITVRDGSPEHVGYAASGYWGGLTAGRLVLADLTHKLGHYRMTFVYIAIGIGLQIVCWFVPNIIADAFAVSFLGFVIGPIFPVGIAVMAKLLPHEVHIPAIGFAATIGHAGAAAFPFLTGAVASKAGVIVLQPIMLGLLVGMLLLWIIISRLK